jgi:hypothetical protein
MVNRVGRRFELKPDRLAGDTVYGAARTLRWLMDRGIEPHIPVWDKSSRSDGTFSRTDFVYDGEADLYICPGGNTARYMTAGHGFTGRARPIAMAVP